MNQDNTDGALAIVFPAKYENERVYGVLGEYADYFIGRYPRLELIVVNDGSGDRAYDQTLEWMKKAQLLINGHSGIATRIRENAYVGPYATIYQGDILQGHPVTIVDLKQGTWKVGAVSLGFQLAHPDSIAGFVDTDGFLKPAEFDKLVVPVMNGEIDCALGSRFMDGSCEANPDEDYNCFASSFKITNLVSRYLYGAPYVDIECGAKVLSSRAKQTWVNEQVCTNLFFDAEMVQLIHNGGYRIREIPLEWQVIDTIKMELGTELHGLAKLVHFIKHINWMGKCLLETRRKMRK